MNRVNGDRGLRGSRADVGQLPLEICRRKRSETVGFAGGGGWESFTLLKLLQTLERDLELVVVGEPGGVVEDIDPKKRYNRHGGR